MVPCQYELKTSKKRHHTYGVIAQQLQKIDPVLVQEGARGRLTGLLMMRERSLFFVTCYVVSLTALITKLIGAIRAIWFLMIHLLVRSDEHQRLVTRLNARIDHLEKKVDKLKRESRTTTANTFKTPVASSKKYGHRRSPRQRSRGLVKQCLEKQAAAMRLHEFCESHIGSKQQPKFS